MLGLRAATHEPDVSAFGAPRRSGGDIRLLRWVGLFLSAVVMVGVSLQVLHPQAPATSSARTDANAAIKALRDRDLVALDRELAANGAEPLFAYYFAREATSRELGDALATAADLDLTSGSADTEETATSEESEAESPDKSLGAAGYERVLTNLADTLALATRGTGDLALPTSWTDDFAKYATARRATHDDEAGADAKRADQDLANKQNLLLLLSRARWSTPFLQTITRTYWDWEHDAGNHEGLGPWPGPSVQGAKYAPSPNGPFLTDGWVALMAALTANSEAAGWAFLDFRPGIVAVNYDGADHPMGTFAHFVFFGHQYEKSAAGVANVGMTASDAALMTASEATGGSYGDQAVGPMADAFVVQGYRDAMAADAAAPERRHGRLSGLARTALDVLGMVPVVGEPADVFSAAWSAYEGDWSSAGLSLVAVIPLAGAAAGVAKLARSAREAGKLVDRSGGAIDGTSEAGRRLAKGTTAGDGSYDFENADDFLAALDNPVPGVTYRHGATTYELAPNGNTLTHLSGPDRGTIERNLPHPSHPGRNRAGQCVSSGCQAASKVKEEQGLKDYEALSGRSVDRTQVKASVAGAENSRLFDGLVRKPDGTYEGIEVKSGGAIRDAAQAGFDGLVSYENPATAIKNGQSIQITSVRLIQVP